MLQKKIFRDIRENRWAFLSIVCICSLGIALFSGINLYVSTVENEVADYYEEANLADYWVYKADISESDLDHLRSFTDIQEAQRRKITDIALSGASNSVLHFHAVDEAAKINVPELLAGSLLDGSETNALLLDSRFAQAHGLSV